MPIGGPGSISQGRRVVYELGGSQYTRNRSKAVVRRTADQIRRVDARQGNFSSQSGLSSDVMHVPGNAWIMKPVLGELVQMTTEAYPGASIGAVTTPPNYTEVTVGKPSTLLGMGSSGLLSSYPTAIRKRVPHVGGAEGDWGDPDNNNLAGDQSAHLSPLLTQNTIPHDRVLLTSSTLGENNAFALIFQVPEDFFGSDALFRVLFGGNVDTEPPAEVDPHAEGAGGFALSVRGSGMAMLYEHDAANTLENEWDYRYGYHWYTSPPQPGSYYSISVIPYGRDRLLLGSYAGTRPGSGFVLSDLLTALAVDSIQLLSGTPYALYQCVPQISGHTHQLVMTGGGPARLDARRDIRTPFGIYRHQFPVNATLTDDVFSVGNPPAGTPLTFEMDVYTEALGASGDGSAVTAYMFNADTLDLLSTDDDGNYLTEAGASGYYVRFLFEPPGDRYSTPALFGYTVTCPMVSTYRVLPWERAENVKHLSVTGPDTFAPDHETMAVELKDLTNSAAVLQQRGRIHARARVTDRQGNHLCTLFEGETMRPAGPRATKRGRRLKPNENASASHWHDYSSILHNGMWIRVADQWMTGENQPVNFSRDTKAAQDPKTGEYPAWKITDAIREMFDFASIADTQLAIPDLDQRFIITSKSKSDDLMLYPGRNLAQAIQHLVRDYLGWTIFFEPNYGPAGRWKLKPPADLANDPVRMEFHTAGVQQSFEDGFEGAGMRVMTASRAYESLGLPGVPQTYIKDHTWQPWIEPPEANFIRVVGATPTTMWAGAGTQRSRMLEQVWINPVSYDADPNNPTSNPNLDPSNLSFLDAGKVQLLVVDHTLDDQALVDWVLLRLVLFAGIGRRWSTWRSPLVTFYDPNDPFLIDADGNPTQRPLRPQDVILVHLSDGTSQRAIVANCNPDIRSTIQEMDIEAMLLPNTPPPPGLPE